MKLQRKIFVNLLGMHMVVFWIVPIVLSLFKTNKVFGLFMFQLAPAYFIDEIIPGLVAGSDHIPMPSMAGLVIAVVCWLVLYDLLARLMVFLRGQVIAFEDGRMD